MRSAHCKNAVGGSTDVMHLALASRTKGPLTKHPECFGKYEEFKTDMYWPITSYRKFYIADKNKFARYNNGTSRPEWFVKE